jgi:hypothetical protein
MDSQYDLCSKTQPQFHNTGFSVIFKITPAVTNRYIAQGGLPFSDRKPEESILKGLNINFTGILERHEHA